MAGIRGVAGKPPPALVTDVSLHLVRVSVHPPLVLLQIILGHLRAADLAADLLVILDPVVSFSFMNLEVLGVVKGEVALRTLFDDVMIEQSVSGKCRVGGCPWP